MATAITTSADEVVSMFTTCPGAESAFAAWCQDSTRDHVRSAVLAHEVRYAYQVTAEQVEQLRDDIAADSRDRWPIGVRKHDLRDPKSLHPLTQINSWQAQHPKAKNWFPPLSFNHAFHILLERDQGRLYTFPEFRVACANDSEVLGPLLYQSELEHVQQVTEYMVVGGVMENMFLNSLQWRLGCAYYAFVKELYVVAAGRKLGFDLRFHPLADTLFRTDFWTPTGTAISMFINNPEYRVEDEADDHGRKYEMRLYLPEMFNSMKRVALPIPTVFGTVELPDLGFLDDVT